MIGLIAARKAAKPGVETFETFVWSTPSALLKACRAVDAVASEVSRDIGLGFRLGKNGPAYSSSGHAVGIAPNGGGQLSDSGCSLSGKPSERRRGA